MANNIWSNYTEKTATPVDADEVMIRDSTDGKNKKLLFGTFWKWVAKKLNEATISELKTDNKTIIGAINAINSDTVVISNRLLPTPTDYISDASESDYTICYKIGKIVVLSINIRALSNLTAFKSYLTLPSAYKPRNTIFSPDISGIGLRIDGDGAIMPCDSVSKGKTIRTVIAYICI